VKADCPRCGHYSGWESHLPCDACSRAERESAPLGSIVDIRLVRKRDGGWYATVDGVRVAEVGQYRGPSSVLSLVSESLLRRKS
jgi:hypothetical protein